MSTQMRPGMTRAERETLRQEILDREIASAQRIARTLMVSLSCQEAAAMEESGAFTSDQLRAAHARCMAEAVGAGCLDPCHDPEG